MEFRISALIFFIWSERGEGRKRGGERERIGKRRITDDGGEGDRSRIKNLAGRIGDV